MVSQLLMRIGIGVVAATVLAAIVGYFLPSTFEIEISLVIKAPPERIHTFTGDLAQWPEWNAWLKDDPALIVTPGDLTAGEGASQTWASGSGEGSISLTRCDPDWGVAYEMAFSKKTFSTAGTLRYETVDDGTEVVWNMVGDNGGNIMARYFAGLMPSLIGPQLEENLARLKLTAERAHAESGAVPEG
jgi:hypothetical protein